MSIPSMQIQKENKSVLAARESITHQRKGIRALLPCLGPAFIACVAYIDPGNYATNIQSGSEFGYKLLWVVVLANLMAMLIHNTSGKLGIATGKNLPEMCREHCPKWLSYVMWAFSEVAAMATDIAEFLGATIGLNLLFHIPMLIATLLTGVTTYLILTLERFGFRPLEKFIAAFVVVNAACYVMSSRRFGQNQKLVVSQSCSMARKQRFRPAGCRCDWRHGHAARCISALQLKAKPRGFTQ
jgi:manganese transport protein